MVRIWGRYEPSSTNVSLDEGGGTRYNGFHHLFLPRYEVYMAIRNFRKHFHAWIEMSPEDMGDVDKAIADVGGQLNYSRWEAMSQLFLWGLGVAKEKLKDLAVAERINNMLVARQLADALDRERAYNKRVFNAVKELGVEKAMEIAAREKLDLDAVRTIIEKAKPREGEMAPTVQMGFWLEEVMGDGRGRGIEEVQEMAIRDGILPGKENGNWDKHWGRLKNVASKKEMCGGVKGVWRLKKRNE
jgi:hypothetical protein